MIPPSAPVIQIVSEGNEIGKLMRAHFNAGIGLPTWNRKAMVKTMVTPCLPLLISAARSPHSARLWCHLPGESVYSST
jgi:hypothetical protein